MAETVAEPTTRRRGTRLDVAKPLVDIVRIFCLMKLWIVSLPSNNTRNKNRFDLKFLKENNTKDVGLRCQRVNYFLNKGVCIWKETQRFP